MSTYRVSPEDVEKILRDYDETIDIIVFIDMANTLTDRVSAKDTKSVLNTSELKQIERCLAAHFYETRDHELSTENNENASGKYVGEFEMGLKRTRHGQNAMMFDETGYLRRISEGVVTAKANWLGKAPSDQTDYVDRD